jgi:hypothetical protein
VAFRLGMIVFRKNRVLVFDVRLRAKRYGETSPQATVESAAPLLRAERRHRDRRTFLRRGTSPPRRPSRRTITVSIIFASKQLQVDRFRHRAIAEIVRMHDGVWFADLAPLSLPELVPQTIAIALGLREGRQRPVRDVLIDTLRDRHLLILDTCEHLLSSCSELVQSVLQVAPAVRIVATSREPLGVPGEIAYRVPSLSLPESTASLTIDSLDDFEATRLFLERARRLEPACATTDNAATIARLCRRLDGVPLAIELAAARIVVLSPEQIEARLEDRFRLLTGGARTAVARQRTLEAAVDWSYQLLASPERELLCRLAVFPATWRLEAAEQICSDDGIEPHGILDLLSKLVDSWSLPRSRTANGATGCSKQSASMRSCVSPKRATVSD